MRCSKKFTKLLSVLIMWRGGGGRTFMRTRVQFMTGDQPTTPDLQKQKKTGLQFMSTEVL